MATAIIGVGNIGRAVARHLAGGEEPVILAARSQASAQAAADEIGRFATATLAEEAMSGADAIVFALSFDLIKDMVCEHAGLLDGKVIIDPSNPVAANNRGNFVRTLPDGVSAGSVVAGLLPSSAHFVKAFGTLAAVDLASGANRSPRVALFFATDDEVAARTAERLITAAGFDPVRAGGLDQALQIEMFGALHEYGGLDGKLVTADEARVAMAAAPA